MIDLMRLFGGEFEEVHSFVSNDFWKHDVEDNAYALMRTKAGLPCCTLQLRSGAIVFLWKSRWPKARSILAAYFPVRKAMVRRPLQLFARARTIRVIRLSRLRATMLIRYWMREVTEFNNSIVEDVPIVSVHLTDALRSMELVFRVYCGDPEWRDRWGLSDRILSLRNS